MSDSSQGDGWWVASDGKWYPPAGAQTVPAPPPPPRPAYAPAPPPPPPPGPPQPVGVAGGPSAPKAKRSKLVPVLLCVAIAVVFIVGAAVLGGKSTTKSSTPTTVAGGVPTSSAGSSVGPSTPSAPNGAEHVIGETGTTSKWAITVNAVKNPYVSTNGFDTPKAGNRYVAVDMTAANNDSKSQPFSTLLQLSMIDSQSYKYTPAIAGLDLPQLGGDVAPGAANRGWVVFEVPATATGLVLRVVGDLTATGTTFSVG